ncbi:hypothetical protein MMC26_003598 [Xylographa opegraphella]|nr:hypothetical protein [Xylographa opegraphella]
MSKIFDFDTGNEDSWMRNELADLMPRDSFPLNTNYLSDRLESLGPGEDFLLGNDKWVIKKSFRHGPTSAAVKLVYKYQYTTELFVCKAVAQRENNQEVPTEVRILLDVLPRNERLCAILEYFPAPDNLFLMKFCNDGDLERLATRYRNINRLFPESFLWHVLFQGAEALAYIHHGRSQTAVPKYMWRSVIHADIKPENIFLQWRPGSNPDTDYPDIKLGDFGLSLIVEEHILGLPFIYSPGTDSWRPPEQPWISFEADVWSLGAVIHYLCHGSEPERRALNRRHGLATERDVMPIKRYYSNGLQHWYDRVLEQDRLKRIDSAVLADSLAGIVPVILKGKIPLHSWAACRPMDQDSAPPLPNLRSLSSPVQGSSLEAPLNYEESSEESSQDDTESAKEPNLNSSASPDASGSDTESLEELYEINRNDV